LIEGDCAVTLLMMFSGNRFMLHTCALTLLFSTAPHCLSFG
jgi:hypothetical protein